MATYPSADAFVSTAVHYRHPERAAILLMIERPAPLYEEFELGIMIAHATEEMDGSD